MRMKQRTKLYWLSQVGGWGLFVLGNLFIAYIREDLTPGDFVASLFILIVGIAVTHAYRNLIHQWNWKRLNILALLPRILLASVLISLVFTVVGTCLTELAEGKIPFMEMFPGGEEDRRRALEYLVAYLLNVVNFSTLFLLWSIIYFAVNTFENWKREEITNLELRASKTEIELNSFKAQMNPHFMFNSMNSIRALVDENPEKAKQAITMLSGILRSNLTLGRHQTIPLREELDLVDKYLSLEKIRFEERLHVELHISPATLMCEIPPFMLQTIVENGVKHGISRRMAGGRLLLSAAIENESLVITILNSGTYRPDPGREGIGLMNTRKRLQLLYGDAAQLALIPGQEEVTVKLVIPNKKNNKDEDPHN
jgi:two-component system, LytTR family, sensor kinase